MNEGIIMFSPFIPSFMIKTCYFIDMPQLPKHKNFHPLVTISKMKSSQVILYITYVIQQFYLRFQIITTN